MKVSILKTHLTQALTKVSRVISSKSQLPILQNVLLETKDKQLNIVGTNSEMTIVVKTQAKVEEDGGICVPAKLFTELISSLPDNQINISVKEGVMNVKSEGYEATLPCVPKEEFPPVPVNKKNREIIIPKTKLLASLDAVLFAAATDEGRPVLTGIKVKIDEEGMLFVATDGYRLSLKKMELVSQEKLEMNIPAKAFGEVVHVGQEEKEVEKITISPSEDAQLGFFIGNTEIYTRVIDGEYPKFEKIIPKSYSTRAMIQKEEFLQAVKSAAIFARDSANVVRLHLEKEKMTISANTPQVGQNKITITVSTEGESSDIAFNSRFLLEYLSHVSEEIIIFEMTGALNSGVFRPQKDESVLHIIMPVRTTE